MGFRKRTKFGKLNDFRAKFSLKSTNMTFGQLCGPVVQLPASVLPEQAWVQAKLMQSNFQKFTLELT